MFGKLYEQQNAGLSLTADAVHQCRDQYVAVKAESRRPEERPQATDCCVDHKENRKALRLAVAARQVLEHAIQRLQLPSVAGRVLCSNRRPNRNDDRI